MDRHFGLSIRGVPITFGDKLEIVLPEEIGLYMAGLFVSNESIGYPKAQKELDELVKAVEILQIFVSMHMPYVPRESHVEAENDNIE